MVQKPAILGPVDKAAWRQTAGLILLENEGRDSEREKTEEGSGKSKARSLTLLAAKKKFLRGWHRNGRGYIRIRVTLNIIKNEKLKHFKAFINQQT